MITVDDARAAAARLAGEITRTPFVKSETLSQITGAEIWLKFENLQFTGSFKQRGALNRLSPLTAEERSAGVIAVSAGNHAQGVAYHAAKLGIPATIIMPVGTPAVKASRTQELGAEVILAGKDFAEAVKIMDAQRAKAGQTLVHPYDDHMVIAGQGTAALEMFEDGPSLDDIVIAIGGGGLISGCATAFRALSPHTRITGVQSDQFPPMARLLGIGMGLR